MINRDGKLYAKVIGGELKGKNIELPSLEVTRSSKSILKESVFNSLQFEIVDENFVEVFGGSGSIGIEAVSRGAKYCYFIEKNENSYRVLKDNLKRLKIDNARAILGDSFNKLDSVIADLTNKNEKAYFYFDPPFSTRDGMEDVYEKSLELVKKVPNSLICEIIIEHMSSLSLDDVIGGLILKKRKKFGKSSISYYIPKERLDNE